MAKLFLLTLPIGNKDDITLRGLETLKSKKYFFAEDTRMLLDLLSLSGISHNEKKINSFHDHSERSKIELIAKIILEGEDVVYVSDAGSPVISDPAYPLIKEILKMNIEIDTIPGVSAPLVALELSGLPPIPFHFYGFLPRSDGEIKDFFSRGQEHSGPSIYFESGQRIMGSLEILKNDFPESQVFVGRELTKKFQSLYRFKACDFESIRNEIVQKGEFVLIVYHFSGEGKKKNSYSQTEIYELALESFNSGHIKSISKLIAAILKKETKEVYSEIAKHKIK